MIGTALTMLGAVGPLLAEIAALIVIAVLGRGRTRRIGVVGAILLLLGVTLLRGIAVILIAVAVGTHWRDSSPVAGQG